MRLQKWDLARSRGWPRGWRTQQWWYSGDIWNICDTGRFFPMELHLNYGRLGSEPEFRQYGNTAWIWRDLDGWRDRRWNVLIVPFVWTCWCDEARPKHVPIIVNLHSNGSTTGRCWPAKARNPAGTPYRGQSSNLRPGIEHSVTNRQIWIWFVFDAFIGHALLAQ